jgi:hypothetical protein
VELRSLVSQAWENLKSIEELLKSGVASGLHEAALRWHLYFLHQNVLDALASLLAEAGLLLGARRTPPRKGVRPPLVH